MLLPSGFPGLFRKLKRNTHDSRVETSEGWGESAVVQVGTSLLQRTLVTPAVQL